jgi:hypothetical protein
MNCFYNPDQAAVGICKVCLRGLSREAATEFDFGLACKGRCEGNARFFWEKTLYSFEKSNDAAFFSAAYMLFLAFLSIYAALWPNNGWPEIAVAVFLAVMGTSYLKAGLGYAKIRKNSKQDTAA